MIFDLLSLLKVAFRLFSIYLVGSCRPNYRMQGFHIMPCLDFSSYFFFLKMVNLCPSCYTVSGLNEWLLHLHTNAMFHKNQYRTVKLRPKCNKWAGCPGNKIGRPAGRQTEACHRSRGTARSVIHRDWG